MILARTPLVYSASLQDQIQASNENGVSSTLIATFNDVEITGVSQGTQSQFLFRAIAAVHPSIGAACPKDSFGAKLQWLIGQVDSGQSLWSIPANRQAGVPADRVLPKLVLPGGLLSGTYSQQRAIGVIPRTPQLLLG